MNVTKYVRNVIKKYQICRFQVCSFNLEMYENLFWPCMDPAREAYDALSDPLALFLPIPFPRRLHS